MPLHVEVVSPESILYEGDADQVVCRPTGGEIAFLPGHQPFVGALEIYPVRVLLPGSGEVVIAEGARQSELFLVTRGTASVHVREPDGRVTRVASFSAGTVLGELALLDHAPRSATVLADEELACFVLTEASFHELKASHPAIAINLLSNLAREVSGRLRRATQTIRHLAS